MREASGGRGGGHKPRHEGITAALACIQLLHEFVSACFMYVYICTICCKSEKHPLASAKRYNTIKLWAPVSTRRRVRPTEEEAECLNANSIQYVLHVHSTMCDH